MEDRGTLFHVQAGNCFVFGDLVFRVLEATGERTPELVHGSTGLSQMFVPVYLCEAIGTVSAENEFIPTAFRGMTMPVGGLAVANGRPFKLAPKPS